MLLLLRSWPHFDYCRQQVLQLVDAAWLQFTNISTAGGNNTTAQQQQQVLQQRLGGSLPVHLVNSTLICQQPAADCAASPCLLSRYADMDPDTAAGYVPARPVDDSGHGYEVAVVLPAVLGSVGKLSVRCGTKSKGRLPAFGKVTWAPMRYLCWPHSMLVNSSN